MKREDIPKEAIGRICLVTQGSIWQSLLGYTRKVTYRVLVKAIETERIVGSYNLGATLGHRDITQGSWDIDEVTKFELTEETEL